MNFLLEGFIYPSLCLYGKRLSLDVRRVNKLYISKGEIGAPGLLKVSKHGFLMTQELLIGELRNQASGLLTLQPGQPLLRILHLSNTWVGVFSEEEEFLVMFYGLALGKLYTNPPSPSFYNIQ
jgi:hypothetical protein